MKYLILIFSLFLVINIQAQTRFEKMWAQVENFEQEGKTKSANGIVTNIYKKAKQKKNSNQLIKALVYQSKFALVLQENAELLVVQNLEKEISENSFPTTAILQSILADFKWQYFNQHRWKIYNRSKTETIINNDFRTWDLNRMFTDIHKNFKASIKNAKGLQAIDINIYEYILIKQDATFRNLRPTLYDFLAHRALGFFTTSESRINKPKERFYVDKNEYFSPTSKFIIQSLKSNDSVLSQLEVLKTYQKLEQFHSVKNNSQALIDVYLARLNFVNQNSTVLNKETVYINSLENSFNTLKKGIAYAAVKATYAIAINDHATLEKNSEDRKNALAICNEIITDYPKSEGTIIAQNLKNVILQETLSIQNEAYVPTTASKVFVKYNNIEKLYFRIYSVLYNQTFKNYNYSERGQKIKEFFDTENYSNQFEVQLPQKGDYFEHSTEVVIPKLNKGDYIILVSTDSNFNTGKTFTWQYQSVSNLVAIESNYKDYKILQVLNRSTGVPIEKAKIHIDEKVKYTNKNGEVNIDRPNRFDLSISYKKDSLIIGQTSGSRYYNRIDPNSISSAKAFLFLDRSIYRPGQKVFFKGIVISKQNFKSEVVADKEYLVIIRDANYQELKTFNLTTNKYGSFSEEFTIPTDILTGNFSIKILSKNKDFKQFNVAHVNFSVEEYKRPKFEVEFKPITETYIVDQEICVKGNAKALLGSAISDAKVNYRIVRKTQYTHWGYWRRNTQPETQEIGIGEVTTDANGSFEINFNAIPDLTKDKKGQPIFNYEITADVTDINGETRSSKTNIQVGYHSMNINIQTDSNFSYDTTETITIQTENLNGEFAPSEVDLKIYKLQAPNRILRTRKLPAPDMPILSESEFIKLFPHEAYTNENDSKNWKKSTLVFEQEINTDIQKETQVPIQNKKWVSGGYVISVTGKDKFGNTIEQEKRITVANTEDTVLADYQIFDYEIVNHETVQKDKYITLKLLTATENLNVLIEGYYSSKHFFKKNVIVNGNDTITIPFNQLAQIPDSNIQLQFSTVLHGDHLLKRETVNLPSKKEFLTIETATFRDKLEPGSKEKWSFTIKNQDENGKVAEVLASMYDASLDQFKPHDWSSGLTLNNYYSNGASYKSSRNFGIGSFTLMNRKNANHISYNKIYAQLNNYGLNFSAINNNRGYLYDKYSENDELESVVVTAMGIRKEGKSLGYANSEMSDDSDNNLRTDKNTQNKIPPSNDSNKGFSNIVARKNLNETAFFYPHLKTNAKGDLTFEFETPETLTRWKVQLLGHTKTGISGKFTQNVVTQKELMVIPNPPRFIRESDTLVFQTKIASLSDTLLNGQAKLELYDALTGKEISSLVMSAQADTLHNQTQPFSLSPKGNTSISWELVIPEGIQAIEYKVLAKAGNFTDGESSILPVLTNRMLVTESIPLTIRANSSKEYRFNKLKNNTSTTLKNQRLTLEYTTNPSWYAIQSLPYVMEFPHECAEQTFARYYANTLGSYIMNSNPEIKTVFKSWKADGKLTSKLEQNEALKQILITETPWLRDAQNETERKKRLGLLFDLEKLATQEKSMLKKLNQLQMSSGGFPWFSGGLENENITRHIVAGFGHLERLGISNASDKKLISKAINYLDRKFVENHNRKLKYTTEDKVSFDYYELYYLYTRSFYTNENEFSAESRRIVNLYINKAKKNWPNQSLSEKAMLSLVLHRFNDKTIPTQILTHLKETSIINEDKGMYWKSNTSGWYWNQAPIETQALVIEAFSEITNDQKTIEELQIWLLNNKRKNNWETTKATTEAVYALLLQGNDWLSIEGTATIKIGDEKIKTSKLDKTKLEAGTGYIKLNWATEDIKPKMADISIKNTSEVTQFGGYHWQYFEQLDKITNEEHKGEIKLHKELFLKKNTNNGPTLIKVENTALKVGDLVTIRIELQVEDNFEYVHLKDMRASTFEPVSVLSQYKWQDGLGYYQSTKDVATHFFFDNLRKGTYVLEYDVRINNVGSFSNGISSIQSMYAPEFTSHSKGITVKVIQ